MRHREPTHLEEWATLLGDELADDVVDADDADRLVADDADRLVTDDAGQLFTDDGPT